MVLNHASDSFKLSKQVKQLPLNLRTHCPNARNVRPCGFCQKLGSCDITLNDATDFFMLLQLVLVLLFVYGVGIMTVLTVVMMYLVRRAAKSRLRLFSIFTALPRPTVMALANRSIAVSGECRNHVHTLSFAEAGLCHQ